MQYFRDWLERDGYPFWPFWENVRSWWAVRALAECDAAAFRRSEARSSGGIRRIATFLDIEIDEARFPDIVEHCSFDYMKRNATKAVPLGGGFWDGGAETFIHKGTNGRWRDLLSSENCARYEAKALAELGEPCASWLKGKAAHG